VRDVASKTADNAARIAALMHAFCSHTSQSSRSSIPAETFEAPSRIAIWHLYEALRFFGELALPLELANTVRLDAWLRAHCRDRSTISVPMHTVQQFGPRGLRSKGLIDAAVKELDELDRARLVRDGRRREIRINPALLDRSVA